MQFSTICTQIIISEVTVMICETGFKIRLHSLATGILGLL